MTITRHDLPKASSAKYKHIIDEIEKHREATKAAQTVLFEMMKADSPIQPGDCVTDKNGRKAIVTKLDTAYSSILLIGKLLKKDGTPGNREFALYAFDDWELTDAPTQQEGASE